MSGPSHPAARRGLVAVAVVAVVAVVYIMTRPAVYTPDIIGVVASVAIHPDNSATYTLTDGRAVTVSLHSRTNPLYGGGDPTVGELLLAGDGGRWIAAVHKSFRSDSPPGCYAIMAFGTDEGTWIRVDDSGLRLPKAASFDPGWAGGGTAGWHYEAPGMEFCLNEAGAVTAYR